jgi:hypothetical protein
MASLPWTLHRCVIRSAGEGHYRSEMPDLYPPPASLRLGLVFLFSLASLPGCSQTSPVAPARGAPTLSGYVYEVMLPGAGEPAIADVLITVTDEQGEASSARTDGAGFYSVRAATGAVVATASKDGYRTREARVDLTDSTVLNFSLRPTTD